MADVRRPVHKTYKLFVGGAFPRSESGRTYIVSDPASGAQVNVARASRKDVRDAVVAARTAFPAWSGATAYNRGQVLHRVAEMMERRRTELIGDVIVGDGVDVEEAAGLVEAATDRVVWYAGWSDKIAQAVGSSNDVAGPYFNFTVPEASGVVAIIAPRRSSLLGLVSVVAAAIVSGNVAVVVAAQDRPLAAVTFAEILATADVPGGVVNILTGHTNELAGVLAAHMDVNAIDLVGAAEEDVAALERAAADNVKRVLPRPDAEPDWSAPPTPARMLALTELKTVWHPAGI